MNRRPQSLLAWTPVTGKSAATHLFRKRKLIQLNMNKDIHNMNNKIGNHDSEEEFFASSSFHWEELSGAYRARELSRKIVALDAMIRRLEAWRDWLLEDDKEQTSSHSFRDKV